MDKSVARLAPNLWSYTVPGGSLSRVFRLTVNGAGVPVAATPGLEPGGEARLEAEYRRLRADLMMNLQRWLRDVWLRTLDTGRGLLDFPDLAGTEQVARRITPQHALENLQILEQTQRLLHTNVQEALAIEVGLLKLHL